MSKKRPSDEHEDNSNKLRRCNALDPSNVSDISSDDEQNFAVTVSDNDTVNSQATRINTVSPTSLNSQSTVITTPSPNVISRENSVNLANPQNQQNQGSNQQG